MCIRDSIEPVGDHRPTAIPTKSQREEPPVRSLRWKLPRPHGREQFLGLFGVRLFEPVLNEVSRTAGVQPELESHAALIYACPRRVSAGQQVVEAECAVSYT